MRQLLTYSSIRAVRLRSADHLILREFWCLGKTVEIQYKEICDVYLPLSSTIYVTTFSHTVLTQ